MEAIELLKNYKGRLDLFLKNYFKKRIEEAGKNDPLAKEAVKMIADFTLSSGKRIRPALVYYAYLAAGGKKDDKIIKASMSIELTHSFLLIHDDIIDKDEKRHGIDTLHERYKKFGRRLHKEKNVDHFGNSMAMLAGDMAAAMANQIIFTSQFSPEIIIRALNKLQEIVYTIVPGEMLDVVLEFKGKATEKEILRMYEGKTSSYSFEGPLHLGTVLAGADNKTIFKSYSDYAMPLGIAFQIRDDILGIFGNEKKIGKPVGSDVIEGKQTLLVIKAFELGGENQKKVVRKYLGKKDLDKKELEEFRQAISDSGSLDYCQKMSEGFVQKALEALGNIDFENEEARLFFEGIAQYMVKREV
jgi:geranylgeranyl diphosphate synthase, type I